jgi:hypothetical protein
MDLEGAFGTGVAGLDVFDPSGTLISSTTFALAPDQNFIGVACDGLIGRIQVRFVTAFPLVDNIRFGTGCQVIADADDFDSLYPDLAFEDFEDSNVPPGGVLACGVDPVGPAGDGGTCFDPGDIEPGRAIGTDAGSGLALVGPGFGVPPAPSRQITGDAFSSSTDLIFSPPVRQVGTLLRTFAGATPTVDVTVFGAGGETLFADSVAVDPSAATNVFWGIACDAPIARIRFNAPGGVDAQFVDDVRFGTSKLPFTRFCVEESVASVNTGLKTKMILETQDGAGNLLPFDKSIAGNGSPNRLMMIAKDAPGLGNGGVTNIGYFIMGTGANTFVPPGSIGPICVAPGLKRFLPPTSMTSETITFHDESGTPTTLVAQGFSRAALGAGAHPVGASIGGGLGFHWSFQAWHRDTPGDSNLSDAIAVDFVP